MFKKTPESLRLTLRALARLLAYPGAELRAPMAIAVIGGVLVSTLLTLFVVPCVYELLARFERDRGAEEKRQREIAQATKDALPFAALRELDRTQEVRERARRYHVIG